MIDADPRRLQKEEGIRFIRINGSERRVERECQIGTLENESGVKTI